MDVVNVEGLVLALDTLAMTVGQEGDAIAKAIEHQAAAIEALAGSIERAAKIIAEGMRNVNANY